MSSELHVAHLRARQGGEHAVCVGTVRRNERTRCMREPVPVATDKGQEPRNSPEAEVVVNKVIRASSLLLFWSPCGVLCVVQFCAHSQ